LKLEILQVIITITAINMIIMAVAIPVIGVVGLPNNSHKPITNTTLVRARFVSYKKGWPQFAVASNKGYLPMVGGSLRLLPQLKMVAII
jgi:hypothetical protein